MTGLLQDLRHALKGFAKNRAFTAVAVLSLTLGIGLNTAAFSVVDAFFLRPAPGRDPARLVSFVCKTPQGESSFSYADYQDIRAQSKTLSGILAQSGHGTFLKVGSESEFIFTGFVSPNFFSVLGVDMAAGRAFTEQGQQENEPVVVLSYARWQKDFAGDRSLLGKSVWLNRKPYTVIGIAPQDFSGTNRIVPQDAWIPATVAENRADLANRNFRDYELLGRLQPTANPTAAEAETETIGQRLADTYPTSDKAQKLSLVSEQQRFRQALKPALFLMSIVVLVLLIACANVAGLMLARAEARRSEFAVRTALGAGRGRLVRQLLTESILLASLSAALGLVLTRFLIRAQSAFNPMPALSLHLDMRLGGPTLVFTIAAALATAVLFGLAPALGISKPDLVSRLKGTGKTMGPHKRRVSARSVLVVTQIALSVVLLAATGLLLRSLLYSLRTPLGWDSQKQLVFIELTPGVSSQNRQQDTALFQEFAGRVRALPGVRRVSYARRALLSGSGGGATRKVSIPGIEMAPGQESLNIKFNAVGLDYFRTMGTRLLEGRDFSKVDQPSGPPVALIDETMARRFWPKEDAVGKHLRVDGKDCEIIGVTERVKINDVHELPEPYMYFPFAQAPSGEGTLVVETSSDPRGMIQAIRKAIHDVNSDVPILEVLTVSQLKSLAFWNDRMSAGFVGALAMAGMFLAAVGLYGVIAHLVYRRSHEIGIRMALGARRGNILALMLGQGVRLAVIGTVIGIAAAFGVARIIASNLYGVTAQDPLTFIVTGCVVTVIAMLASYLPARRAAKIEPMEALRYE